jgi:hypothetical protein
MKLRPPLYDGDSFLRSGPEVCSATEQTHSTPDVVHCTANGVPLKVDDIKVAVTAARALRANSILRFAQALVVALGDRIARARRRSDDAYLARAKTLGELEDRLRHLERQGSLSHV